jgi:hypothetical protein
MREHFGFELLYSGMTQTCRIFTEAYRTTIGITA